MKLALWITPGRASGLAAALAAALLASGCPTADDGSRITDVEIVDNPHNALSCLVRWRTDAPATSRVEFGDGDTLRWFVADDVPVVEHELLVFGLHADTDVTLQPVSVDEAGEELRGELASYRTGAVPFDDLLLDLTVYDEATTQPGWTLTNVSVGDVFAPVFAVILDEQARPIWYRALAEDHGRADVEVSLVAGADADGPPRILIGGGVPSETRPLEVDLAGVPVWEGPPQPDLDEFLTPGEMHHTLRKLASGDYLRLVYELEPDDGYDRGYDLVEVIDAGGGEALWSWRSIDHLPRPEDYVWSNAALLDPDAGVLHLNSRNFSALYEVDVDSGELNWTFGEGGDFAADPDAAYPWPSMAHAPEWQPGGTLLLYDNGDLGRGFSRVVEFEIDTAAMTSRVVWEYPGALADDVWFNFAMGDADRQPNGNTLITAGSFVESNSTSRVFEVTADGAMAWELWLSGADGQLAAAYMAERIPRLIGSLDDDRAARRPPCTAAGGWRLCLGNDEPTPRPRRVTRRGTP